MSSAACVDAFYMFCFLFFYPAHVLNLHLICSSQSQGFITNDLITDKQRNTIRDPCCSHSHGSPYSSVFTDFSSLKARACASCGFPFLVKSLSACFATSHRISVFILLSLIKACDIRLQCAWTLIRSRRGSMPMCEWTSWSDGSPLHIHTLNQYGLIYLVLMAVSWEDLLITAVSNGLLLKWRIVVQLVWQCFYCQAENIQESETELTYSGIIALGIDTVSAFIVTLLHFMVMCVSYGRELQCFRGIFLVSELQSSLSRDQPGFQPEQNRWWHCTPCVSRWVCLWICTSKNQTKHITESRQTESSPAVIT